MFRRSGFAAATAGLVATLLAPSRAAENDGYQVEWPAAVQKLRAGAPGQDGSGLREARATGLRLLQTRLEPKQEAAVRYGVAYADAFAASLAADPAESARLLAEASAQLQEALKVETTSAEVNALLGFVYALQLAHPDPGTTAPWSLGLAAIRSAARAEQLEPRNPRVALLQGIGAVLTPAAYGGSLKQAEKWLRESLGLFEAEPRERPWPSWGRFEAHLWLAHVLTRRGDAAGAQQQQALAAVESPSGAGLFPIRDKETSPEYESIQSLYGLLLEMAAALREADGAGVAAFFEEPARVVGFPLEPTALQPGAKWLAEHGWKRDAAAGQRSRRELASAWSAFFSHWSELEDAHLELRAVELTPARDAARLKAELAMVGRDAAGKREWTRGTLALSARFTSEERWTVESLEVLELSSMLAKRELFSERAAAAGLATAPALFDRGAAAADLDGDGNIDLVVAGQGQVHLYLNDGHGGFQDRSKESGLAIVPATTGVLALDVDNDGDLDLFFSSANEQMLFENRLVPDGKLEFRDVSLEAGVGVHTVGFSLAAGDVNGDGLPDVYVCGYNRLDQVVPNDYFGATNGTPNLLFINQGGGRFKEMGHELGVDDRGWSYDAELVDFDGDGDLDLFVANDYGTNALYKNELKETGRLAFHEVGREVGATRLGFGMGVSFGDYNNDGMLDLHATYLSTPAMGMLAPLFPPSFGRADEIVRMAGGNALFEGLGGGRFREVSERAGPFPAGWAWGGGFIDVDNDGWADLHSVNGLMSSRDRNDVMPSFIFGLLRGEKPNLEQGRMSASSGPAPPLLGLGPMSLERLTPAAPAREAPGSAPREAAGPAASARDAGDRPAPPGPAPARSVESGGRTRPKILSSTSGTPMGRGRSFAGYERDTLYLNLGNKRFLDISGVSGIDSPSDGRAAVYADFDNDGAMDIFVTTLSGNLLFHNEVGAAAAHLRISLEGTRSGRDAFGAIVRVQSAAGIQAKVKSGGEGHLSQHDPRLLFGLGSASEAAWVEVRWPSGLVQRFEHVPANRSVKLTEGSPRLAIVNERRVSAPRPGPKPRGSL